MALSDLPSTRRVRSQALPSDVAADRRILDRRVGKSGAVCIPGLEQGTRVRVVSVRAGVYLVSPLPVADMEKIIEGIPAPEKSPFAALSASLVVRRRGAAAQQRLRHAVTGVVELPQITDEAALAKASLEKPRRRPR